MTTIDARDRFEGWLEITQQLQQQNMTSHELAQDDDDDGDDDGSDPEMESLESLNEGLGFILIIFLLF